MWPIYVYGSFVLCIIYVRIYNEIMKLAFLFFINDYSTIFQSTNIEKYAPVLMRIMTYSTCIISDVYCNIFYSFNMCE